MGRTYDVDKERKYPSVTSVCSVLDKGESLAKWMCFVGFDEATRIKEAAGVRGTKVHQFVSEWLISGTKPTAPDGLEDGRLDAIEKYFNDVKPKLYRVGKKPASELVVWSSKHGYAGTLDAVLVDGDRRILVDWKTSKEFRKEYALQTAAYAAAWNEQHPRKLITERQVVRFTDDGNYAVKSYHDDMGDFAGFLGALALYNWAHK